MQQISYSVRPVHGVVDCSKLEALTKTLPHLSVYVTTVQRQGVLGSEELRIGPVKWNRVGCQPDGLLLLWT